MKTSKMSLGGPLHIFVQGLLGATPDEAVESLPGKLEDEVKAAHFVDGQKLWEDFRMGDHELGLRMVTSVCANLSRMQGIEINTVEFDPETMKLCITWDYNLVRLN